MNNHSTDRIDMEHNSRAAYLIAGFIQENLSEEEEEELESWMQESERNLELFEQLTAAEKSAEFVQWYFTANVEQQLSAVKRQMTFTNSSKKAKLTFFQYAVAACLVSLISLGVYLILKNNSTLSSKKAIVSSNELLPGHSTAVLDLGNGQRVLLAGTTDSAISPGINILNGTIIYSPNSQESIIHTLSVPRKGFYQLTLPDGSRVWLNSESSIRYPAAFTGNDRRVAVTGETYFEVAKNSQHPFIVSVDGIDITALGTAFNVNAYSTESGIKATLTEGSVAVTFNQHLELLSPGEELTVLSGKGSKKNTDVALATAWTNNEFKFKNSSIEEVLRLAARWYDAEIVYEGNVTDHFTGTISRNVPIEQFLKLLQTTGEVQFEITGKKIIVHP